MFTLDEQGKVVNGGYAPLLDAALRHLADAGLDVAQAEAAGAGDSNVDLLVRLTGPRGPHLYVVELKSTVSPGSAGTIRANGRARPLVVTGYVSESLADLWRHQDIHYVDSAGNMYLRWDELLLDVRGRRNPSTARPVGLGGPLRAFKPSGLKVLFVLLADPELVNGSYREIAHASGTALGTVQRVFKELEQAGYLDSAPGNRQLHRVGDLFRRWVEAYPLDLAARLTLARFDTPDPTWWTRADNALRAEGAQWGGETAAHHLGTNLRPGRAVIYAAEIPKRLALDNRFQKTAGEGTVEIRERFWRLPGESSGLTVPTILVYADLVASADPRQHEAAEHLREHDAVLRRLDGR